MPRVGYPGIRWNPSEKGQFEPFVPFLLHTRFSHLVAGTRPGATALGTYPQDASVLGNGRES